MVDLPCLREAKLVRDRREDLDNCEGSFMFGGKLGVGDRMFEISG